MQIFTKSNKASLTRRAEHITLVKIKLAVRQIVDTVKLMSTSHLLIDLGGESSDLFMAWVLSKEVNGGNATWAA